MPGFVHSRFLILALILRHRSSAGCSQAVSMVGGARTLVGLASPIVALLSVRMIGSSCPALQDDATGAIYDRVIHRGATKSFFTANVEALDYFSVM